MLNSICVFASGSEELPACYYAAAQELGALIGRSGQTLIYGGAKLGVAAVVANAVQRTGGKTVGVIPRFMQEAGLAQDSADELVIVDNLRERKRLMEERSDAFVAMPGGFGTVEEIMEILALRQLVRHHKPVVFLSTNGFYGALNTLFERMYEERFAKQRYRDLYQILSTPREVVTYLEEFKTLENR